MGMKAMPQLRFSIRYDLRKVLPDGWSGSAPIKLASGNAWSSHGDVINGWTEEGGKALVEATKEKHKFIPINGRLGNNGDKMSCEATDADPSHGTSDYADSISAMSKRSAPAIGWASRSRLARNI
jgi:hypothetical protein